MPSREDVGGAAAPWKLPTRPILLTLAAIAVLAAVVLGIEPLREGLGDAIRGDTASLREDLRGLGVAGALIVLVLALAHAFVWYPTEILDAAVGYVYGFWVGLALLMVGWILNAIVGYWVGRHAARPLLWRWLGRRRLERYETVVHAGGIPLLLGMRLVPIIPFSLFSYAAGSARVPMGRYLWTTAVGYLPLTAAFTYLGSRLEELSLGDPLLWLGVAVVLALLLGTRRLARSLGLGSEASP